MSKNWKTLKNQSFTPKQVLKCFGVKKVPVPIGSIAEGMGVNVRIKALEKGCNGKLDQTGVNPVVYLHSGLTKEEKRFILAHELGHLLLHPKRDLYASAPYSWEDDPRKEKEPKGKGGKRRIFSSFPLSFPLFPL